MQRYQNINRQQKRKCFNQDDSVNWKEMPDRRIITNVPDPEVVNNKIQTTHSNFITFVPNNLLTQLAKPINVYFVIVAFLQIIPSITYTDRKPLILIPLSLVTFTVLLKDAYEELSRYFKDRQQNNKNVLILDKKEFIKCPSQDILIGNVIKVFKDEYLPCDMVLLQSSDQKGKCFLQTKNLDGQTNLKPKKIPSCKFKLQNLTQPQLFKQRIEIKYQKPTPYLNSFNGSMNIHGETIALSQDNLLLKGCALKNVDEIAGVAVYTGKQSKLMLNSVKFKQKSSQLDKMLNKMVIVIFVLQFVLSFICGMMNLFYQGKKVKELRGEIPGSSFLVITGSWWLLMTSFVPISLVVTLELVKVFQGAIMSRDKRLFSPMSQSMPILNNSKVNENLGQIRYICSDKTGTLTCNVMNFKKLHVSGREFGKQRKQVYQSKLSRLTNNSMINKQLTIPNVTFYDQYFIKNVNKHEQIIIALSLCHQVVVEKDQKNNTSYSSSSPDQISIINFCKLCGFQFLGEKNGILSVKDNQNVVRQYKIEAILQFSSNRKRMSIIVNYNQQYFLYTKGADSHISGLIKKQSEFLQTTQMGIDKFSNEGLRTLMVAMRKIQKQEVQNWLKLHSQANISLTDRKQKLQQVYQLIQKDLEVIGATGVEDQLQQGVAQTIQQIKQCGIVFYILTGDKRETAINVGRTCGMISQDTQILIPQAKQPQQIEKWIQQKSPLPENSVLMIDASCPLPKIPLHPTICYRCTPTQKQIIVQSIQSQTNQLVLAIGDGSNDINMVTKANFGVGLKGKQGNEVTRVADVVIGQFCLLSPLLLHYGRQWYRRNSKLINYNFFKNIYHLMALVSYGGWSFFSGSMAFDINIYMFFNVLYTTLPIICYAVFDNSISLEDSMRYPKMYCPGQQNKYFNQCTYWKNNLIGTIYGILTSTFSFIFLQQSIIQKNGRNSYFAEVGMTAFLSIVIICNLKVQIMAHGYSHIILASSIISILSYFVLYYLYDYFMTSDIEQSFFNQLKSPMIWMVHGIFFMIMIGLDLANKKFFEFKENVQFNQNVDFLKASTDNQEQ